MRSNVVAYVFPSELFYVYRVNAGYRLEFRRKSALLNVCTPAFTVFLFFVLQLMGPQGLKEASKAAILNANYMAKKLQDHYKVRLSWVLDNSRYKK